MQLIIILLKNHCRCVIAVMWTCFKRTIYNGNIMQSIKISGKVLVIDFCIKYSYSIYLNKRYFERRVFYSSCIGNIIWENVQ